VRRHPAQPEAACFGPDGALLANHRKLVLPPGFETRCFIPGQAGDNRVHRDAGTGEELGDTPSDRDIEPVVQVVRTRRS
jgi:hypothetical protein